MRDARPVRTIDEREEPMMDALLSARRRLMLGALGSAALLAGCGRQQPQATSTRAPQLHFAGEAMGSTYNVKIAGVSPGPDAQRRLQDAVHDALAGVDRRMSTYREDSELSRLNRHARGAFPVSEELLSVLAAARAVSEASGGAFDVSVAPLVDAWGFGVEKRREVPAPSVLAARRASVDYRGLRLDARAGTVTKAAAGVQADLGGIAKGFAVDLAARALEARGIGHYMVEAGGEVRTRGLNASGEPWRIGIERPDATPQRAHFVIPLSGRAMATSGDYRIFYEHQGRRYSHEIDPASAAPIDHGLASVTVVAEDCMHADAWATALIVMGAQRGHALASRLGLAAYFLARRPGGGFDELRTDAFAVLGGQRA